MKAIAYRRVSTAEQSESGLGLSAQETALRQECFNRGWEYDVRTDAGYSAKPGTLDRPALSQALDDLQAGRGDVLLVTKLDRLARSTLDFARLMAQANDEGWAIVALDLGIDMTTPQGKFVASIMSAVAELERDMISQRTRDALAVKKAEGMTLGRPPRIPETLCERIQALRASGSTLQAIADLFNAENIPTFGGGKQWWPSTVQGVERRLA